MTDPLNLEAKIVSRAKAKELAELRKQKGDSVVFTNGVFDILHAGHVQYLSEAKKLGDFLILGLNSDSSVKRLKGPERPIQKQQDRAIILAGLWAVDLVVLFEEDTPLELIELIQPSILVKGGDYTFDTIVGAREVARSGGIVKTISLVEGKSTTNLIKLISGEQK